MKKTQIKKLLADEDSCSEKFIGCIKFCFPQSSPGPISSLDDSFSSVASLSFYNSQVEVVFSVNVFSSTWSVLSHVPFLALQWPCSREPAGRCDLISLKDSIMSFFILIYVLFKLVWGFFSV